MPVARVINATAPIRICDNGGWTDTWFAGHGKVFNIAVLPSVEVQVAVFPAAERSQRVVVDAENYGDRFAVPIGGCLPGRHPLLEAAIDEMGIPEELAVEISIFSGAPAGASTGTSASVTVALIGALDALTPGRMTAQEVAQAAHRVETERLGLQSGIQDQLCAAYGGINFIEVFDYPRANVRPVAIADRLWWELERRLVLVFLGRAHQSSAVHDRVISRLEREGEASSALAALRKAAERSRDALAAGDFGELGAAMVANTATQAELHAELIGKDAQAVIDIARQHGALGWKVNGAGGDGGSVTLLCGAEAAQKRRLLRAVSDANPSYQAIPISLSRAGLRVWDG